MGYERIKTTSVNVINNVIPRTIENIVMKLVAYSPQRKSNWEWEVEQGKWR